MHRLSLQCPSGRTTGCRIADRRTCPHLHLHLYPHLHLRRRVRLSFYALSRSLCPAARYPRAKTYPPPVRARVRRPIPRVMRAEASSNLKLTAMVRDKVRRTRAQAHACPSPAACPPRPRATRRRTGSHKPRSPRSPAQASKRRASSCPSPRARHAACPLCPLRARLRRHRQRGARSRSRAPPPAQLPHTSRRGCRMGACPAGPLPRRRWRFSRHRRHR